MSLREQIKNLMVRFAEFYRFAHRDFIYDTVHTSKLADKILANPDNYWSDEPDMHLPLAVLNNGDCFVAALAVGEVMRLRGASIKYHSNGAHYFISAKVATLVGRSIRKEQTLYFDTLRPEGTSVYGDLLSPDNDTLLRFDQGDAEWFSERALESALDVEFIEQFVRFYFPTYVYPYPLGPGVDNTKWFYQKGGVIGA